MSVDSTPIIKNFFSFKIAKRSSEPGLPDDRRKLNLNRLSNWCRSVVVHREHTDGRRTPLHNSSLAWYNVSVERTVTMGKQGGVLPGRKDTPLWTAFRPGAALQFPLASWHAGVWWLENLQLIELRKTCSTVNKELVDRRGSSYASEGKRRLERAINLS